MAELKAQTTRGVMLGEKPPELVTLYAPDGTSHSCSPVDAREILAAGLGYTTAPLTGGTIINAAYAEVAKREQQSEQQSKHGDGSSNAEAGDEDIAKPDNSRGEDSAGQAATTARNKTRK